MSDNDAPFSFPYGVPAGPSYTTDELLARFLAGALLVRDEVADTANLRRGVVHGAGRDRPQPRGTGHPAGRHRRNRGVRPHGYEWGLWARDLGEGRAALAARATPDMPGLLDQHQAHQHDQARTDAVLRQLEDDP